MINSIKLRWLEENDWKDMFEYGSDYETVKFLKQDRYKTKQDAIEHNKQLRTEGCQAFVVILEGKMIGMASIKGITEEKLYISYVLNKKYWSKGYGTQVLRLIHEFAKREHPNKLFLAVFYKENIASQRILEKCGFVKSAFEYPEALIYEYQN